MSENTVVQFVDFFSVCASSFNDIGPYIESHVVDYLDTHSMSLFSRTSRERMRFLPKGFQMSPQDSCKYIFYEAFRRKNDERMQRVDYQIGLTIIFSRKCKVREGVSLDMIDHMPSWLIFIVLLLRGLKTLSSIFLRRE